MVWYKQIFGELPQKVVEKIAYKGFNISTEFKTSGYKMEATAEGISLTIQHTKKEHGGLYYCEKSSLDEVTLSNGTFLAVAGK